ncbi:cobalamin B12-binding domain-containing protein [bacterium]|nr:cobalamin B12-binding domain-containing protein [bacterium]
MKVLLVNPPNSGRSIPEEKYGIDSMRRIFVGEPLGLEVLAAHLGGHEVGILDLKAEPEGWERGFEDFGPDLVAFTAMTCETNSVLRLAGEVKKRGDIPVVVGGIHASNDPESFNRPGIDYIVKGLGEAALVGLVEGIDGGSPQEAVPGVARVREDSGPLVFAKKEAGAPSRPDLPPRYDLVARHRGSYILAPLGLRMGFVATAWGCPHRCVFCCVPALTDGRYITRNPKAVVRDIGLLEGVPVIRLVDANTFGDLHRARELVSAVRASRIEKHYLADVRADTVVKAPDLMREWREAGLRAVVIGFEEVADERLRAWGKGQSTKMYRRAIDVLHEIGVTIVGDFIVSPDYEESDFEALGRFVRETGIDLPILSVLTPLPGTALFEAMRNRIVIRDLDYYTLTNAVTPTRLPEEVFYRHYADLVREFHAHPRI